MSYGERLRRELLHRGLSPTSILSVAALTRHWSRRSLRIRRPQRNSKHQPLQRSTSQHRCSRSRRQHWERRWVLANSDDRMRIGTHPFSVRNRLRGGEGMGSCTDPVVFVGQNLPVSVVNMPRGNVTMRSRACRRLYRLCSPYVRVLRSYNSIRKLHTLRAPNTFAERGTPPVLQIDSNQSKLTQWWPV